MSVVQNAKGAVDSANKTLATVNGAAGDVRITLGDAQKAIESAKALLARAQTGGGLIATLVERPPARGKPAGFRGLNLRQRGVLFYKNSAAPPPTATPRPVR